MVNVIPPDHVDDVPIDEPNQHDDVYVVPEPVLVDEDEDPEEEEFEEEEDPQEEEEDDMEVEDTIEPEDETVPASVYEESVSMPLLLLDTEQGKTKCRNDDASGSGPVRGQDTAPTVRKCTFAGFMKCNPTVFYGVEGAVKLRRTSVNMVDAFILGAVRMAHKWIEQKSQARDERILERQKRKWESFQSGNSNGKGNQKDNSRQPSQNNQKQGNARAMVTLLLMERSYEELMPQEVPVKYVRNGFVHFVLAYVTDNKSKEKRLEDVPVIYNFPEVFYEELPGLPPPRKVEFRIDLVPGLPSCTVHAHLDWPPI
ncbi:hypothetical protein Tco_0405565 [Tanacetum coccineum]